jgi:uncharacterized protein (TIGR03437 family)
VQAGSSANCQLRLTGAGDASTETILSATDPSVHVPQVVRGRPKQSIVSFQVIVDAQSSTKLVSIRAAAGDSSTEETIAIQASAGPTLSVPATQFASFGGRLSFRISAASEAGILSLAAANLPRGANFSPTTGEFDWSPDPSQPGVFRVDFSATDAAQRSAHAQTVIRTGSGTPVVDSLENAATGSQEEVCASGSLATVRGGFLAPDTRILINGEAARVVLGTPNQVTFACPPGKAGTTLSVAAENSAGRSGVKETVLRASALGVLTVDGSANGSAAAILGDNQVAAPRSYRLVSQPAQAGDVLRVPVTGLPVNADARLVILQLGDLMVSAESLQQVPAESAISIVGVCIPRSAPLGDAVPIIVHYHLPDGTLASSQTTSIAIEGNQQ